MAQLYEIHISLSINKILLKHSHILLFIYYMDAFTCSSRVEYLQETGLQSLKYLPYGLSQEVFDLWTILQPNLSFLKCMPTNISFLLNTHFPWNKNLKFYLGTPWSGPSPPFQLHLNTPSPLPFSPAPPTVGVQAWSLCLLLSRP